MLVAALLAGHASATDDCSISHDSRPVIAGEFAPEGIDIRTSPKLRPGDDFFGYVNDPWIESTPIPEGYWDYGQTSVLGSTVATQVQSILHQSLASTSPRGSAAQQVGDAYASFLDTAELERRGLATVHRDVERILALRTRDDIARWMADPSSSSIIAINVYPDAGTWRVHLDQQNLTQPMLGLPDPAAYSRTDGSYPATLEAYCSYVAGVLASIGVADAPARAAGVVRLESRIAANLWPFEKLLDRRANHHRLSIRELEDYAPGFPWRTFLAARHVARVTQVVLGTDTAVQRQSRLFAETAVEDWSAYLAFHWLQNQIDVLPERIRQASWVFYGKTLANATAPPARDEVAARLVGSTLGQQVGRLYAERYVTAQTKTSAEEMIAYLRKAFAERLDRATWMDEETKAEARAKLERFRFKVGYPGVWRDFSDLRIAPDDAAGNLRRTHASDWAYQLRRLDANTNDEPWFQTPQTVDASYSVLANTIELPGAFLQRPYFDADVDPAVNFGAIGAIVGHEMGHGFNDQGILFDGRGELRDWWSKSALEQFNARAGALVAQYDAFTPYPGVHVDGRRTLGENIADLSGVSLAYRAYHLYLLDHPCERPSVDGLSGDQRFFMAWAQAWRYKAPESAVRYIIEHSTHSPAPYRVNGVVRNLDAWYAAFGVGMGDALYVPPDRRVRIW